MTASPDTFWTVAPRWWPGSHQIRPRLDIYCGKYLFVCAQVAASMRPPPPGRHANGAASVSAAEYRSAPTLLWDSGFFSRSQRPQIEFCPAANFSFQRLLLCFERWCEAAGCTFDGLRSNNAASRLHCRVPAPPVGAAFKLTQHGAICP